jgi:uncharacterized protein (TIGR00369 family)
MENLKNHPLIQKYIEYNNFGRTLGMDFIIESAGNVSYTMLVSDVHLATPNTSHGGAVAGLMDAVLGVCGLSAVCMEERLVSTVEMGMHFIKPAKRGDLLTAKAAIVSKGNRIIIIEGKIHNQLDELIASGSGTFNAYPKEKAGL